MRSCEHSKVPIQNFSTSFRKFANMLGGRLGFLKSEAKVRCRMNQCHNLDINFFANVMNFAFIKLEVFDFPG